MGAAPVLRMPLIVGVIAASAWFVSACGGGGDTSTVVTGQHTLTYTVTGDQGMDAGVVVTFGDPLHDSMSSQTITTVPWSQNYSGQNPDAAWARMTVDNSNNDTDLNCTVVGDGSQVLVAKDVPAGQSVDCAALHF